MRTVKMKTQTFLHENLLKHFPLQFNDTISPEPPAHNVCNTLLSAFRCDCPERSTQGPLELLLPGAVAFLCSEEIMIARRASGFLEPDAINISASAWQIVSFYSRRFCVGNCPQKAYLYTGAGSTSEQSMFVCLYNLAVSRTGDARLRIFFVVVALRAEICIGLIIIKLFNYDSIGLRNVIPPHMNELWLIEAQCRAFRFNVILGSPLCEIGLIQNNKIHSVIDIEICITASRIAYQKGLFCHFWV